MSEAWELTGEEMRKIITQYDLKGEVWAMDKGLVRAATRKAVWQAIYMLEQAYGKFSAAARLLRAEAQGVGLAPWPDPVN